VPKKRAIVQNGGETVKYLGHSHPESARRRARELANTPEFSRQHDSEEIEADCGTEESDRTAPLRLRRHEIRSGSSSFLAAAAQNIKRLVRFPQPPTHRWSSPPKTRSKNSAAPPNPNKISTNHRVFQHPRLITTIIPITLPQLESSSAAWPDVRVKAATRRLGLSAASFWPIFSK